MNGTVRLTGATFSHLGATAPAVTDLTLEVGPGQELWLTGPNSSGKSTALAILAGIIPDVVEGKLSGEIDLAGSTPGMVMQDSGVYLFRSVYDEISFPLENRGVALSDLEGEVTRILCEVGIADLVGRQMHTLSGGERQKVAVAAALAVDPDLLLLDEPFEQLDPRSVGEVLALARDRVRRGVAVVVATREPRHVPEGVREVRLGAGVDATEPGVRLGEGTSREQVATIAAKTANSGATATPAAPALAMAGVTHTYPGGASIGPISLSVAKGESVALLGPNGAGKTTVMKHVNGLLRPDGGRVLVGGVDIAGLPVHEISRAVGMLFQNPDDQIFNRTVVDEVSWGLVVRGADKRSAREAVRPVLDELGLAHVADRNPHELTGSARQLVACASVLAVDPSLIVLDEPTKSLDSAGAELVARAVDQRLAAGAAVLLVTHDLRFAARLASRCAVLADGEIVAEGATADVVGDEHLLRRARLLY